MPMANRMTKLLNKIERRIGTRWLNLPDDMGKDVWAREVIAVETIDTFSRFFPHKMLYFLNRANKKNGYYLIDEAVANSVEIIGAGDIDWHEFSTKSPAYQFGGGFGTFDLLSESYDAEDIMMTQMIADHVSLFSNGIYVEYEAPNKIKLSAIISNDVIDFMQVIPINLYVNHSPNLMTIEPTKMETFEELATADVAKFLYNALKGYDGVDSVFATTDMKLSDIQAIGDRRDEIVEKLKESYVSPANKNQPIMYTIN